MRHNAYQTMVPVSHEENIYLPTAWPFDRPFDQFKSMFNSKAEKDKEQDAAATHDKPDEKESMLPSVLKVVFVLALVFGVGLGVPIFIANNGERCCRGGDEKSSLMYYCKNTDPIDMWQQKSGRNCDYYEDYPQYCDEDSKDVLVRSKCFDEVHWKDDVQEESCAEKRGHFVYYPEEEKAWCETAFGETKRASRKDANGKWIYFPSNMTAQAACCFCGEKKKTANFEAINTPKKHCCGCRIKITQVGSSGSIKEEYDKKVSEEGGSCDPNTDKKVEDLESSKLVSRNKLCSGDPSLALALIFAIVWWVVVIYFTKQKYFPNKNKSVKDEKTLTQSAPKDADKK